jgi:hypothetical protein
MLIDNRRGGYSFLKGIAPYSAGVVAAHGYQIEHARFSLPVALAAGFDRIDAHLKQVGRPPSSLCALELRSPRPFTFQGFNDFNSGYVGYLESRGILMDGLNPVARTNVAPESGAPSTPAIYAFSYTLPSAPFQHTFIVAGAGELPEGSLDPHDVVRAGESSPDALAEKARFVLRLMTSRLQGLGARWEEASAVNVYSVHDVGPLMASQIVPAAGNARHGVTWHYARPPITGIEFEMDLRGCAREIVLPGGE